LGLREPPGSPDPVRLHWGGLGGNWPGLKRKGKGTQKHPAVDFWGVGGGKPWAISWGGGKKRIGERAENYWNRPVSRGQVRSQFRCLNRSPQKRSGDDTHA